MWDAPQTRLAPSPTGALHLGNARTFLANWLLARSRGWRVVLRIEDIDSPRVKPDADVMAIDVLHWLGLDWDDAPIYQSTRSQFYRVARDKLISDGHAYPCVCTRREVDLSASAPHAADGSNVYPGTCRGRFDSVDQARNLSGREPAIRFAVPQGTLTFTDGFAGQSTFEPSTQLGDFVIFKNDLTPAYQLAVVVDDAAFNITHVVRGDDLLDSTPRQILLYQALGLSHFVPTYFHLPLVVGPDGRRLAKRHGDTRVALFRDKGVTSGKVRALLAGWCGIEDVDETTTLTSLIDRFDLTRMSRLPVVYDQTVEQQLLA